MTQEDQAQPQPVDAVLGQPDTAPLSIFDAAGRRLSALLTSLYGSGWTATLAHASAFVLLFYALYTAFFSIALINGRVLAPGDGFVFSGPAFYGSRALWTPDLFAGFPVGADPQNMTWYPLSWLFSRFPGSFSWFVVSAYVLASSFTYGYLYSLTRSRLAAFTGGMTYGMSGFFMAHLGHAGMVHAAAWMPLVVWSLEKLRTSPERVWLAALAIGVALGAMAGHLQIFLYLLLLAVGYAVVRGWQPNTGRLSYYGASAAGLAIGVGMAGVVLLPAYELTRESVRSSLAFDYFSEFALPWKQLPQLVFPYLFGGQTLADSYYPDYFGDPRSNHPESAGYVGLVPPVLALGGLWLCRRSVLPRVWAAVAVIALLLALGDATPLARLLFHLPVYNLFRVPGRHLVVAAFAVSVLAGLGTASAVRADEKDRIRGFQYASLALLTAVVAVVLGLLAYSDTYRSWAQTRAGLTDVSVLPWENASIGIPLVMLAVGLAAVWIWVRWPAACSSAVLLGIIVLDLGSFGWFNEWRNSPKGSEFDRPAELRRYEEELAVSGQRLTPLRGLGQSVNLAAPNVNRLWGLPSAAGFNPLIMRRYSAIAGISANGELSPRSLAPENTVLDILAVRYLFVPALPSNSVEAQALAADPSRWRHVQDLPSGSVYSNERALPRAWLATEIVTLTPEQVLDAIQHSALPDGRKYDPKTTALVEHPVDFAVQTPGGDAGARVTRQGDTSMAVQVDTDSPAFLVLSDAYYPGWKATVDGESSRIYRTDYVLRGVEVPPGAHLVEFEYRPASFRAGAAVSAASALALVTLLAWPLLRRRAMAIGAAARLRLHAPRDVV